MRIKLAVVALLAIAFLLTLVKFNHKTQAQNDRYLQPPFQPLSSGENYRIVAYVDHKAPIYESDVYTKMVLFNGLEYNDCPASTENWTIQGPYCYNGHSGIDWAMVTNTLVLAATSGNVLHIGPMPGVPGLGNVIRLSHNNNYETRYAHLNKISVSVTDKVTAGQQIGFSGDTGGVSPHLHFEVRHNSQPTDPFGWQGTYPDPLISYTNRSANCLWANEWCNETVVEDGDINFDGSVVKFAQFGPDWSPATWRSQGHSWTMKYLPTGDGSSSGYWIPYLNPPGIYEVFAFIPAVFTNTTTVTYTIHDRNTDHVRVIDQSTYANQWVRLGSYHFDSDANNYIKLTNATATTTGTHYVVFDAIKFRNYFLYTPLTLKTHHSDTYEPNDDFTSAFTIQSEQDYHAYIWPAIDEDWFKSLVIVPVGKERVITVDLRNVPTGTNYDLALYDEDSNLLSVSTNDGNNDEHLSVVVSQSGSYRIKVYAVSGFSQNESYNLQLRVSVSGIPKMQ